MNSTAIDLTAGHEQQQARARRDVALRETDACAPDALSAALLMYWRTELPRPVAGRRRSLDVACWRLSQGIGRASDLLPFALGDTDDEIVQRATIAYLGDGSRIGPGHQHLQRAVDWIRRRLALNCAAVFAALLSLDDEGVCELLRPLRFALDERDCERVQRRFAACSCAPIAEFVRTWSELRGQRVGARADQRARGAGQSAGSLR